MKNERKVIAIDPGQNGAIVVLGVRTFEAFPMPINAQKDVDFGRVFSILERYPNTPIFLERAVGFAMGTTSAFNYGRGFASLEIAAALSENPLVLLEPAKWTKVMHAGIKKDLKAKAKSLIAVKRLFPKLWKKIPVGPKSKKLHDGIVDALLIAGYALNHCTIKNEVEMEDF